MLLIRAGQYKDLNSILNITRSCALNMKSQGIFQWNEYYPDKESFINDAKNNELFVYTFNEMIIGCISLCDKMDKEYANINWITENNNNLYIHRLAVDPNWQKLGVGKLLMDFAEEYAKKNKNISVRLDTFSENKRNLKFYESRGYHRLDKIYFPKQSEFPFYCYELIL